MMDQEENPAVESRKCSRTSGGLFCSRTSLFVLVAGYALLGAVLFKSLEGGDELDVKGVNVQRSREDCLKELWLITERLNVLYEKNWTRLVTEQLKRFERVVTESGKHANKDGPHLISNSPNWTFSGAFLYSLTLLTTIGYGRLSPRTALGKIVAIIYAIIGVPLMLILLSALGSLFASGARKLYMRLSCYGNKMSNNSSPTVGYQKAPCISNHYTCGNHEDTASIQINSCHSTPSRGKCANYRPQHCEVPKRAILATVRATHSRRSRHEPIQSLVASDTILCPTHGHSPLKNAMNLDEADDLDDSENIMCSSTSHDTPSRVPLIWRPPETVHHAMLPPHPSPSVPATLVLLIFVLYIGLGAATFSSLGDWSIVDATYFCFIALSTVGIGDRLAQGGSDSQVQMQIFACCLYVFFGLIVVAMCFSLVHDELNNKRNKQKWRTMCD